MVRKKRIRKYLDKQLNGMQKTVGEITKVIDRDKLHRLRVHAKKVKAIAYFLKESFHHKMKYSIGDLKEVFNTAGEIRTAQLNLETSKDLHIESEPFIKEQHHIIENKSKEFI